MYFPNNKHATAATAAAAAADLLQETTISNIIRIQSKSMNKNQSGANRVSNSEIKKFYSHYLGENFNRK
jgi:hypothetical protein